MLLKAGFIAIAAVVVALALNVATDGRINILWDSSDDKLLVGISTSSMADAEQSGSGCWTRPKVKQQVASTHRK